MSSSADGRPAALVLADHPIVGRGAHARCGCWLDDPETGWRGDACDHPAHLADMLDRAGLLADGTPPETPTTRVLAERADRSATSVRVDEELEVLRQSSADEEHERIMVERYDEPYYYNGDDT